MSAPPRVRPVSPVERIVTTALVPAMVLLAARVPLSHVDVAALGQSSALVSPFAMGVTPFVTAYALVELAALLVPALRRWRHDAKGRLRLERTSAGLGVALALLQAWGLAQAIQQAGVATAGGGLQLAEHTLSLTAGSCVAVVAARWVTQRGLVNGTVLWWTAPVVIDLLSGGAFREAWMRGGLRNAALLAVALIVAALATVVATWDSRSAAAARPGEDSAYRDGQKARPRLRLPVPVSSIQPILVASSLLLVPSVLATMGVPGTRELQTRLERGHFTFDAVYVVLVVVLALAAAALLCRPEEVSALLRRLGRVSDEEVRAAARDALRRAWPATLAFLLALVAASMAAHVESRAAPSIVPFAVAVALLVDLGRSARAHMQARDLVCLTRVHDAYAVAALRGALAAEGVESRPRGTAVFSLLQAFAAYAPAELYVSASDAERAAALLRHWAAGEAKPVGKPTPLPREGPERGSRDPRAAVLAVLCAIPALVLFVPRNAPTSVSRSAIAIVRVDDAVDPLRGAREADAPNGVFVYGEDAPLAPGHSERRSYARISLTDGETLPAAWARVLPWLRGFAVPDGHLWTYEPVTEPVEGSDAEGAPPRFQVVGLRTLLLAGEPVITTADVEDAEVGLEEGVSGRAYVLVTLTPAGGDRFYQVTQEWVGRRLAIVVDDHVDSAPVIRSAIRGGRLTVTMGVGTPEKQLDEARRLAASLRPPQ